METISSPVAFGDNESSKINFDTVLEYLKSYCEASEYLSEVFIIMKLISVVQATNADLL